MTTRPNKAIEDIELQIKRLKEKQKRLIDKSEKEIGQFIMKEWGIEDTSTAKEIIRQLKDQATWLLNQPTDPSTTQNPTSEQTKNILIDSQNEN